MSNTAIQHRAPSRARTTAQRVADGVVAGYIRALAAGAAESGDEPPLQQARLRNCAPGRVARSGCGAAVSARRQLARRRVLVPA